MSDAPDPWAVLGLPPDAQARDVRSRYAEGVRRRRPEDDPDAFAQLRWAYETCTALIAQREAPDAPAPEIHAPHEASRRGAAAREREALGSLRPAQVVVDELAGPPGDETVMVDTATLDAWIAHSAELNFFASKDAIERELLRRLLTGRVGFRDDAIASLDGLFGWWQLDAEQRLQALGVDAAVAASVVAQLQEWRERAEAVERENARFSKFHELNAVRFARRAEDEPRDVSHVPVDEGAMPPWLRALGFARRAKFHRTIETYLHPTFALPILVVATWLMGLRLAEYGASALALVSLATIGALLGVGAFAGTALAAMLGRDALINTFGGVEFYAAVLAALLPAGAWAVDRIAVGVTGWPHAPTFRRGTWTFALLALPAAFFWLASRLWGPYAPL